MYYSDELYHHGIKGQRWGRRNGPPYPLSAQTHAAVVRSAGRGSSKKKGKVGRLPYDMEGYRRATSDEIYKTMNSRPTDAEAQETRRLYRERDRAATKSFLAIPTTAWGAGLTAAGIGARSIPIAAAGAGLTAAGLGAGIAGKRQMSKFRKDLDTAANANLKRRRISNMRSYNGVLYKKGKNDSVGTNKSGKIGNIPIQFKKTTPGKEIIADSKKLSDSAFKNKYKISKEQYNRGLSEARRTGKTVEIGVKGLNDSSDDERRAKIRKRILIGAGVAAGLAGGALIGRKLYQNKAALGMAGREVAAKDLRSAYARNEAAKKEAANIANNLKSQRDKLVVDRFNAQTARGNLSGKRGIREFFKRRNLAKKISNFDSKIAANEAAKAKNAWAAGETEMKYQYAKRGLLEARKTDAALKKLGNRQALASTLGLGVAGAAAGYGTSKLLRSKNQNRGTIGGIPKRLTPSSTDSAVTRRAKQNYNTMSDAEFRRRFSVSKETYAKRVEKYGDPYMNAPLAKLGKRLNKLRRRRR